MVHIGLLKFEQKLLFFLFQLRRRKKLCVPVSVLGRETDVTLGPGYWWKGTHCTALTDLQVTSSLYAIHSSGSLLLYCFRLI